MRRIPEILNNLFKGVGVDEYCEKLEEKYFSDDMVLKIAVSKKTSLISDMFNLCPLNNEFILKNDIGDEKNMDKFFDEVYFLFSKGFAQKALDMLNTIKEDNSEYGRVLFYKSVILSVLCNDDIAEDLFKESVIFEVSKTAVIDSVVLRNSDFDNVLDEIDNIAESVSLFNNGFDYYMSGDFEKALDLFDLSLELNPNDSETLYYKALTLANLDDFEIPVEFIDRAIALNSHDNRFWNDKANFLTRMDNYTEAIKCFNKVIELNPVDSVFFANKGFAYLQMENYEKALECYKKSYELDSNNIHNIVCLANAYVELYDFPKADKYFRLASKINDEDEEYLTAMAHYMAYLVKLDESIEYWDKLFKVNPNQEEIWCIK